MLTENGFRSLSFCFVNASGHKSCTALNSLGVNMCFVFVDTRFRQGPEDAARSAAGHCANQRRCEPSRTNNRTYARNCKGAKSCEEPANAADRRTNSCTSRSSFG